MKRTTHEYDQPLVVFLIGMRIRQPWHVRTWLEAFLAMPPMLAELSEDPDSGMLGFRTMIEGPGATVVQYWESTEKLIAYAGDADQHHRSAWTNFYRAAKRHPGAVGIWHETYVVDRAETFYGDMPTFGLAKASREIPVGGPNRTAAKRLRRPSPAE